MKKSLINSILVVTALTLGGAAAAQGMNPYSTGLNEVPRSEVHSNQTSKGLFGRPHYDKSLDRDFEFRLGLDLSSTSLEVNNTGGKTTGATEYYGAMLGVDIPVGKVGIIALDGKYSNVFSGASQKAYDISGTYKYQFEKDGPILGAGLDYKKMEGHLGNIKGTAKSVWGHVLVEKDIAISSTWKMTPQLKGSYLIQGKYSASGGAVGSVDMKKGYASELGVGITRDLGGSQVTFKPYYRYTVYGKSKVVKGGYVPKSTLKEAGVQMVFTF